MIEQLLEELEQLKGKLKRSYRKVNIGETMKEILSNIAKLIDVKSILTILFGIYFVKFTNIGLISGEQYYNILMIIIPFYFGTQVGKIASEKKAKIENEKGK